MEQYFLKLNESKNVDNLSVYVLSNLKLFFTQFQNNPMLTVEEAESIGFVPYILVDKPKPYNVFETEYVEVIPTEKTTDGRYIQKYELKDIVFSSEEEKEIASKLYFNFLKNKIKESLNLIRLHKEQVGFKFTFSDGIEGTIQTRNSEDIRNIQNLVLQAQIIFADGSDIPAFTFKDAENVMHEITAKEMLDIGSELQKFITSTYKFVWTLKDTIDGVTDTKQLEMFIEKLEEHKKDCVNCNIK